MAIPYDPEHITYFGETDFRNQRTRFGIKSRDRTRHMYVIGKSGVGKSTLLENMAIQDIQRGEGVAVLDPHGSFAEKMLEYVPESRIKDVVYFAPFDTDYPISFNVLEDVGHDRRHLVVSGLISAFKKIWVDAWSARMEYILTNTLLALLEYPDATLLGVNRMLSDKSFRNKVVENITDMSVKAFWTEEFAKYTERMAAEAVPAIQNKIGQFTANPLVRNIIGQPKSSFDIRKLMDEQKILIINLSKGRIGDTNTSLLGSMIITKIYLSAMSRAEVSPERMGKLANFYFYVDEFQSFANETFADILAEARKYKLALIIAHQYVAQMEEKVRDAVFGNVGTTVSFRVGPLDAELLEKVFAPQFTANDLVNLGMAQIYLSLMINDIGSPPFSARTLPPLPRPTITFRNDVIEASRTTYAQSRQKVEDATKEWFEIGKQEENPKKKVQFSADQPRQQEFERPERHQPFKKIFTSQFTGTKPVRIESQIKTEHVSEQPPKPSAKLKELLDNLTITAKPADLQPKEENTLQEKQVQQIQEKPFNGEKPLREAIPPVKFAERGPTEKNKELLRAALGNALGSALKIEPSTPLQKKEEPPVIAKKSEPKVEGSRHIPQVQGEGGNGEVSAQALREILK